EHPERPDRRGRPDRLHPRPPPGRGGRGLHRPRAPGRPGRPHPLRAPGRRALRAARLAHLPHGGPGGVGAGQRDDAVQRLPPPRGHRRGRRAPELAHPALGHRPPVPGRGDPPPARRAPGRGRRGARAGRELRGVVPGAHGAHPLRALHPALHGEAVGPPGARAVGAVGAPAGVRALGQRPVPLSRPLPGLARRPGRLHGPHRRAAGLRAHPGPHRSGRHAGEPRRTRARRRSRPHRPDLPAGRLRRGAVRAPGVARDRRAQRPRPAHGVRAGRDGGQLPGPGISVHPDPRDQARLRPAVRGDRARLRVHGRPDPLLPHRAAPQQRLEHALPGPHPLRAGLRPRLLRRPAGQLRLHRHGRLHAPGPRCLAGGARSACGREPV
ncbi:MAG: hypothetical protein AVDCRST_MAG13-382, partial [uncultured Solirubrobacteraceae bacterium]